MLTVPLKKDNLITRVKALVASIRTPTSRRWDPLFPQTLTRSARNLTCLRQRQHTDCNRPPQGEAFSLMCRSVLTDHSLFSSKAFPSVHYYQHGCYHASVRVLVIVVKLSPEYTRGSASPVPGTGTFNLTDAAHWLPPPPTRTVGRCKLCLASRPLQSPDCFQ